jgi:hypothetical protein
MKNQRHLYPMVLCQPNEEYLIQLIAERSEANLAAVRIAAVNLRLYFSK